MSRLEEHRTYIERVKATGSRVITVMMPCCQKSLDVHVPHSKGSSHEWTSLMICPHCGDQWMSRKTSRMVQLARPLEGGEVERFTLFPSLKQANELDQAEEQAS